MSLISHHELFLANQNNVIWILIFDLFNFMIFDTNGYIVIISYILLIFDNNHYLKYILENISGWIQMSTSYIKQSVMKCQVTCNFACF